MSTFNPTPAEAALTSNFFNLADPHKLGIVTGDTAVEVLAGANLSHTVLGEVWAIADKENNGFLTRKGVAIALRLIGYAQKGEPVSESLLNKPGPLAHVDGVTAPPLAGQPTLPSVVPKSSPSGQSTILPPLTQQDKAKFLKLFIGCEPINGLLSSEKARDVFVKSKLPYDKLFQIWTLADTKARGALDSTDFIIGMYLIQASMSSNTFTLPATLPSWIYDQAAQRDANAPVSNQITGGSTSAFGSPRQDSFQIPRQYTGSGTTALNSGAVKPQYTGPISQAPRQAPSTSTSSPPSAFNTQPFRGLQTQAQQWDISSEAKSTSDQFFDGLDSQRRGYIEGDVAVPFMLQSKLPEDDLARVWDLVDLQKDGKLTRDNFAVAMHLINSRLAGAEIPAVLPLSLVPPSVRKNQGPITMGATGETQLDLLGDDTPPSSAVPPQFTGGSAPGASTASAPIFNHNAGQGAFQNAFPQSRQPSAFLPAVNKDLLGDDDDETSKGNNVPDNSAEIGNLQNQVASTTRSHSTTQADRVSAEQTVAQQASQLSQLQTQLSAAKASYETESRLLGTLRERLASQRVDIQKTQEELIRAESDLSATKVEKAEVEGSVLRDKEEIRDLQRRMKETTDEADRLKSNIEKLKKDARQQKGLLAIAKKQLATAEAEKLKASRELDVVQRDLDAVQKEKEEVDARAASLEASDSSLVPAPTPQADHISSPAPSTFAAGIPLPETPQSGTPQPSGTKQSTNPFERLAMASASGITGASTSPFPVALSSDEAKASENTTAFPDPFGFSTASPDSSPSQTRDPAKPSLGAEDGVIASSPVAIHALPVIDKGSSPSSAVSPSDNDMPFLTPPENDVAFLTPSTGNVFDNEAKGPAPQGEQSLPGAFLDDADGGGALKPLQEVENDDSDTSDSDDEPLGTVLTKKAEKDNIDTTSLPAASSNATANTIPTVQPTFEDAFGVTTEPTMSPIASKTSPPTSGTSSPKRSRSPGRALSTRTLSSHSVSGTMDPFGASTFTQTPLEPPAGEAAPPPTIETVLEPSSAPVNVSNISDFDEALGKMPNSTKDPPPAFKFDSTFDDNFDFSSAINGNTDAAISPPNENGFTTSGSTSFGTFPSTAAQPPAESTVPRRTSSSAATPFGAAFAPQPPVNGGPGYSVSFDDAFGLNSTEQPHTNGHPPISNGDATLPAALAGVSQDPTVPAPHGNSLPPPSSPTVPPKAQPSPPPVRETSPAIRPVSPQQRRISVALPRSSSPPPPQASSTKVRVPSVSKPSPERKADGPPRHKLSIRFPFGRKDKTKDKEEKRAQSQAHHQLLDQQQYLSPVSGPQSPGTVTPAVEDDAEPVKQLAAMGFSRTQSIAALETHGYDVQKALNSLLGAA